MLLLSYLSRYSLFCFEFFSGRMIIWGAFPCLVATTSSPGSVGSLVSYFESLQIRMTTERTQTHISSDPRLNEEYSTTSTSQYDEERREDLVGNSNVFRVACKVKMSIKPGYRVRGAVNVCW